MQRSPNSPLSSQTLLRPSSASAWPLCGASLTGDVSITAGQASSPWDDGCAAFSVGAKQAGFDNASDSGQFFDLSTQTFLSLTVTLESPSKASEGADDNVGASYLNGSAEVQPTASTTRPPSPTQPSRQTSTYRAGSVDRFSTPSQDDSGRSLQCAGVSCLQGPGCPRHPRPPAIYKNTLDHVSGDAESPQPKVDNALCHSLNLGGSFSDNSEMPREDERPAETGDDEDCLSSGRSRSQDGTSRRSDSNDKCGNEGDGCEPPNVEPTVQPSDSQDKVGSRRSIGHLRHLGTNEEEDYRGSQDSGAENSQEDDGDIRPPPRKRRKAPPLIPPTPPRTATGRQIRSDDGVSRPRQAGTRSGRRCISTTPSSHFHWQRKDRPCPCGNVR